MPPLRCPSLLALSLLCLACKRDPVPSTSAAPTSSASSLPAAPAPPSPSSAPAPAVSGSAGPRTPAPPGPPPPFKGGLSLDPKPVDIGTGALVELGAVGAVVRRKDDEILLVRLGDKIAPLSDDGKLYARGKTLLIDRGKDTMSYWITGGKLRRRLIDAEGKAAPVETVADDAEDGTVPHGVRNEGGAAAQDVVAYVARKRSHDGERHARVWVEGKGAHPLSSEGSGAASAWVTAAAPGRLVVVWNDARSALTPVHAASLELDGAGEPRVGPETVLWMGSPSESFPSISAVRAEGGVVALLPLPRNGLDFGLAAVPVVFGAPPVEDASWLAYPNGLDPAPVLPARFCDKPLVALVRPTAQPPSAPKAVELASVESSGRVTVRLEVGRAGRVDHLAAWISPKGDGWVAWVGDGRTWIRHVRCGK